MRNGSTMTDKSKLLEELRIDRSKQPDHRLLNSLFWWLACMAVLLLGGAVWLASPLMHFGMVPIKVAITRALPSAQGGTSILDASGYVVARRQATVSAKITGKLDQLFIEEGQQVRAGEIVAKLDDSNTLAALLEAKASVAQACATVTQARAAAADITPTYLRDQKQAAAGLISRATLDASKSSYDAQQTALGIVESDLAVRRAALEVALRNEDDTIVRAPFNGVITSKNAQPGEIISPLSAGGAFTRTGIGTLVDMDSLEVEVDVSENFISRVRANAPTILKLNAYPDWQIPAHVIAVVPTADRSKATVKVRIGFNSRDSRILPEMGARVSFLSNAAAPAGDGRAMPVTVGVMLPLDAVQLTDGGTDAGAVFVVHGNTVERRVVKLGARSGNEQIVLGGLSLGERVAVDHFAKLADGVQVKQIAQ